MWHRLLMKGSLEMGGRGQYFLEEPAFLQGTFEGREWLNSSLDEEEERKTLLTTSNTVFDP